MFGKISPELAYKKENLIRLLNSAGYPYSRSGIKKYQKDNNIPISGKIDLVTMAHLEYSGFDQKFEINHNQHEENFSFIKLRKGKYYDTNIKDSSLNNISEKGRIYYIADKDEIKIGDGKKAIKDLPIISLTIVRNFEEYKNNIEEAKSGYIYLDKYGNCFGFNEKKKEFYQL